MKYIDTKYDEFKFRKTTVKDVPLILLFIMEIAEYEKMVDQVIATEDVLKKSIFEDNRAEVLIAEVNGEAIGYVLYCFNFSTFVGRGGLYLEDIYFRPEFRGRGYGREAFSILANIAIEKDCGRMEWVCLNWNEPSIQFYKGLGAISMDEWTTYRLDRDKIKELASK